MLLRNLFVKSLLDHRRGLAWWVLGVVLLCAAMTSFYPSISTNDAIQDYVDAFDPDLLALFGFTELLDITSGPGYLNAELFSFMVPVMVIIFAVSLGASAIAGEEDKRTMEILLTEPVSRRRVLLEKYAFLLAANAMLGVVVWLSLAIGAIAVGMDVSMFKLAATTLSSALLGVTFGSLAFAVGAFTGNRGLSIGVSAGAGGGHLRNQHTGRHRRHLRACQMALAVLLLQRQRAHTERLGPAARRPVACRNRRPRHSRLPRLPAPRPADLG